MKTNDERGSIMLESTYCILAAVFLLMFLLSFGFFLYQKTVVTIVANQVAEEVSQTYKLRNVTDRSSVSSADAASVGKYRYLLFDGRFQARSQARAKTMADSRLSQTNLAKEENGLTVKVKPVVDDIGRRHYEVTVGRSYSFLLGDLLNILGIHDVEKIEKTVYVESSDVLNYVNTVKATKFGLSQPGELSNILGAMDTVISTIQALLQ